MAVHDRTQPLPVHSAPAPRAADRLRAGSPRPGWPSRSSSGPNCANCSPTWANCPTSSARRCCSPRSAISHTPRYARVLGCEVARVKALVFRARSGLIQRREARETPCESIQEQLATLRGGSLRRTELRLHLRGCAACRAYRDQVRRQRQLLAAALPVAPNLALKSSVLAAAGIGGGSSAGGVAAGLTSIAGAFGGAAGSGVLAQVAIVGVLAGGAVAGQAVLDSRQNPSSAPTPITVRPPEAVAERGKAQAGRATTAPVPVGTKHANPVQKRPSRAGGKDAGGKDNQRTPARGRKRSRRLRGPRPDKPSRTAAAHSGTGRKPGRTSRPEGIRAGSSRHRPRARR